MGVTIFEHGWLKGKRAYLTNGMYYGQDLVNRGVYNPGSWIVDDNTEIVVWNHWSADSTHRYHFGPGTIEAADWMLDQRASIQVIQLDGVTKNDCAELWDGNPWRRKRSGSYSANWILTPTTDVRHAYTYFKEDAPSWAYVPDDYTLTLYEHGDGRGRQVTLQPGLHELKNYGMDNWASSYKLVPDSFTQHSIKFHTERAERKNLGTVRLIEYLADNTHSDSPTTFEQNLSKTVSKSVTTHWENSTSVTASFKVTIGGEAAQVKAEVGIELSNTFTIGEDKTTEESETISRSISKEVPARRSANLVLTSQYGQATVPFTVELKNNRTGAIKSVNGTLTVDTYSRSSGTAEDL